mgnify:CR=1 FL=1
MLFKSIDRQKAYFYLYWLILAVLAVILHSEHFLNIDEGVTLNGAWNLYNGRRLYFDFFAFVPPLSFYLIDWLWKLIGVSFWSAKIFSVFLLFLGAIGSYKTAEKLKKTPLNFLVPLFFIFISSWLVIINHNFYHLIAAVWAVYFFIAYWQSGRYHRLVVSGLLTGVAILCLQQKGLALAGTFGLLLLFLPRPLAAKMRFYSLLIYGVSVIFPVSLMFLFWPPALLYKNLVDFPLFHYIEVNRISYRFLIISAIATAALGLSSRKLCSASLILYAVVTGLFIFCYPLPDYYHLDLALIMLVPLLPEIICVNSVGWRRLARVIAVVILIWMWLWPVISRFATLPFGFFNNIKNQSLEYVRRECAGKTLQAGPFFPNFYLETGKLSATSFDVLITGHQTPEQFILARRQLEAAPPDCAVTYYPKFLVRFHHNQNNPVENFIRDNYHPVFVDGVTTVWKYGIELDLKNTPFRR